jgi:hypothetical protein
LLLGLNVNNSNSKFLARGHAEREVGRRLDAVCRVFAPDALLGGLPGLGVGPDALADVGGLVEPAQLCQQILEALVDARAE